MGPAPLSCVASRFAAASGGNPGEWGSTGRQGPRSRGRCGYGIGAAPHAARALPATSLYAAFLRIAALLRVSTHYHVLYTFGPLATRKKKTASKRKPGNGSANGATHETVDFHYIKGPGFRTIHVDGALGGLTPSGFLHIAVYAERMAIPRHVVQAVTSAGQLGEEIKSERESKAGVVRQLEVDLFVNEDTARNIRNWLDDKLEEFADRRKKLEAIEKGRKK